MQTRALFNDFGSCERGGKDDVSGAIGIRAGGSIIFHVVSIANLFMRASFSNNRNRYFVANTTIKRTVLSTVLFNCYTVYNMYLH